MSEPIWLLDQREKEREQAELYLQFPADFSIKAHLVLLGDITLSTDQYADDPGVSIPGRGVERSVAVLKCNRDYNLYTLPLQPSLTLFFRSGLQPCSSRTLQDSLWPF